MTFDELPKSQFGAILADPPWHFQVWAGARRDGAGNWCSAKAPDYDQMTDEAICALPVAEVAAPDCVLFMWTCWPVLKRSFAILDAWGFTYKTCAFSWLKADPYRLFVFDEDIFKGLGYWTRANTEPCLLATRGKPKRQSANVLQGIVAKRREHSRKPDGIHDRIEKLVAGPYLELFARQQRPGWTVWGNQTDKFKPSAAQEQTMTL
jgi:N6-adenosine-specific RNA methylase IME4